MFVCFFCWGGAFVFVNCCFVVFCSSYVFDAFVCVIVACLLVFFVLFGWASAFLMFVFCLCVLFVVCFVAGVLFYYV